MVSFESKLNELMSPNYSIGEPEVNTESKDNLVDLGHLLCNVQAVHSEVTGGRRFEVEGYTGDTSLEKILSCAEAIIEQKGESLDASVSRIVLERIIEIDAEASKTVSTHKETAGRRKWAQRLGNLMHRAKGVRMNELREKINAHSNEPSCTDLLRAMLRVRELGGKNQDTQALQNFIMSRNSSITLAIEIAGTAQERIALELLEEYQGLEESEKARVYPTKLLECLTQLETVLTQRKQLISDCQKSEFSTNDLAPYSEYLKTHVRFALERTPPLGIAPRPRTTKECMGIVEDAVFDRIKRRDSVFLDEDKLRGKLPSLQEECEKIIQWGSLPMTGQKFNAAQKAFIQETAETYLRPLEGQKAPNQDHFEGLISQIKNIIYQEVVMTSNNYGAFAPKFGLVGITQALSEEQKAIIEHYAPGGNEEVNGEEHVPKSSAIEEQLKDLLENFSALFADVDPSKTKKYPHLDDIESVKVSGDSPPEVVEALIASIKDIEKDISVELTQETPDLLDCWNRLQVIGKVTDDFIWVEYICNDFKDDKDGKNSEVEEMCTLDRYVSLLSEIIKPYCLGKDHVGADVEKPTGGLPTTVQEAINWGAPPDQGEKLNSAQKAFIQKEAKDCLSPLKDKKASSQAEFKEKMTKIYKTILRSVQERSRKYKVPNSYLFRWDIPDFLSEEQRVIIENYAPAGDIEEVGREEHEKQLSDLVGKFLALFNDVESSKTKKYPRLDDIGSVKVSGDSPPEVVEALIASIKDIEKDISVELRRETPDLLDCWNRLQVVGWVADDFIWDDDNENSELEEMYDILDCVSCLSNVMEPYCLENGGSIGEKDFVGGRLN